MAARRGLSRALLWRLAMSVALATASPVFEEVACYGCGRPGGLAFIDAQDDLTGKPGSFRFVTCETCGLTFQNPRVSLDHIRGFYDDDYIAHRKTDWGLLNAAFERAMSQLDAAKDRIVSRYVGLHASSAVLDVGCGVGTFLQRLRQRYGAAVTGVDFVNLATHRALRGTEFHCALFYEAALANQRFDVVTMWHFLEHD